MVTTTLAPVSLDDKYASGSGRIYLTGVQALVRLPLVQRRRDRTAGLNTGGFISGYRGSPLGTYDTALWHAASHLRSENIHFQPGLNEDLAATSLWGTQQLSLFSGSKVDGVFGIWYGKGPGVDRSTDPIKHANLAGTSRHGGVLALAGDDHLCQSSSVPHQSEPVFSAAMIPVLHPTSIQDILEFGLFGFALSRFSGAWVGMKLVSQTVETSASISLDVERRTWSIPTDFEPPPGGLYIRWPDPPLEQEARLHGPKMSAVAAFARANRIDRIVVDSPRPRLGIVSTGKAYGDLREALADLGIGDAEVSALGIRIYKLGLAWPVEVEGAKQFASGLTDLLVVEEKRAFIEEQFVKILYHVDASRRPTVVGKTDEAGKPLLPSSSELTPALVGRVVIARLKRLGVDVARFEERLARLEAYDRPITVGAQRAPFFCAGCPHNRSTILPEGSRATAGIGCHGMLMWMPYRNTSMTTHMGGEGMMWLGQAPFTSERHVFQNLGDGTYTHSGSLAVRAAVAARVNITYKILYNDAVAMTGGQAPEAGLSVAQIARQMSAEGVARVVVVADDPDKYPAGTDFGPGTSLFHRDELERVQEDLRDTQGVTILIYDQTCAAEKRRRRKRGTFPDPAKRVFINETVCEGCGDCSNKSHCIAVQPLETEFGRKRQIDQSICNKDYSCLNGFCPSFVTVEGGTLRAGAKSVAVAPADPVSGLASPGVPSLDHPYSILVTGIGGTGVVTIGALLGMAAHLEGKGCTVLDFVGLAQKNGAVSSHIRLARTPEALHTARIPAGGANLLVGCDMVVAAGADALRRLEAGKTRAVVNASVVPTGAFVTNPDAQLDEAGMRRALQAAVGQGQADFVDATGLATAILGDAIAANLFMLGFAWQKGLVPLSAESIERAIELNAVAATQNKRAFAWGRLAASDVAAVERVAYPQQRSQKQQATTLEEVVERRVAFLTDYQDAAYADRYRRFVDEVDATERSKGLGGQRLAIAVAKSLFKLMAYKDEYEVARLLSDRKFLDGLRARFNGETKLKFHLAPPLWADRDQHTGELRKREYGQWLVPTFRILARLKGLRGTAWDVFAYMAERKVERRLITEYEALVRDTLASLSADNHALAVEIAGLPERIRGYGHVKERNLAEVKARQAELLAKLRSPTSPAAAAE